MFVTVFLAVPYKKYSYNVLPTHDGSSYAESNGAVDSFKNLEPVKGVYK